MIIVAFVVILIRLMHVCVTRENFSHLFKTPDTQKSQPSSYTKLYVLYLRPVEIMLFNKKN